jgi:dephospho-CoA kinase
MTDTPETAAQRVEQLESTLDLMRDEFARIKALAPSEEIIGLCERAVSNITQHTSLIEQRDKALDDLQECRRAIQFKDEAEQQEMDRLRQEKAELERKLAEERQEKESLQRKLQVVDHALFGEKLNYTPDRLLAIQTREKLARQAVEERDNLRTKLADAEAARERCLNGWTQAEQDLKQTEDDLRAKLANLTYKSEQATECAGCGKRKHTPLRRDEMGGYVCLTCIDKRLDATGNEFSTQLAYRRLREALEKYKSAMDAIYNHNEASRAAVIQYFGIHHPILSAPSDEQLIDRVVEVLRKCRILLSNTMFVKQDIDNLLADLKGAANE